MPRMLASFVRPNEREIEMFRAENVARDALVRRPPETLSIAARNSSSGRMRPILMSETGRVARYLVTCLQGKRSAFLLYDFALVSSTGKDFLAFHLAEFGKNGGSRFLSLSWSTPAARQSNPQSGYLSIHACTE